MSLPASEMVREAFEFADQDRTILQFRWQNYKILFKTNARRLELLNESGSTFFVDLQRILLDTIVLGICRMLDPASQSGRENTSLRYLVEVLRKDSHEALVSELEVLLRDLDDKSQVLRAHRNKRIGHHDRLTRSAWKLKRIDVITVDMVDDVLARIGKFLNHVQLHFGLSVTVYDFLTASHAADLLIERLKDGAVFDELWTQDPLKCDDVRSKNRFYDA